MKKGQFRNERKYYLAPCDAAVLRSRVACMMLPDVHGSGGYKISSLYFDDVYDTALREKLSGVAVRDKWRLRWYDDQLDFIRLELKHKENDLGWKVHVRVTRQQFERFEQGDMEVVEELTGEVGQRFRAVHHVRRLRPVVLVSYWREAFCHDLGNVRITFDNCLRAAKPASLHSFPISTDQLTIVEVKYDHMLPNFIRSVFCGAQFTQLALSKYVMARLALMQTGFE
ncbi:MAG: polyphosphate polymerase domain-containing protein [Desulfovibrio sp.]|nr:polyphosphate polymerase domain-containing protein [Desulfovibrio sp.]